MNGELVILAVAYVLVWLLVWNLTRQNERLLKINEQLVFNNRKLLGMLQQLESDEDEYNHSDCAL
jgi:hypothetical protein